MTSNLMQNIFVGSVVHRLDSKFGLVIDVVACRKDNVVQLQRGFPGKWYGPESLIPVNITPSWLEKLGFSTDEALMCEWSMHSGNGWNIEATRSENIWWFDAVDPSFIGYDVDYPALGGRKYVHELQILLKGLQLPYTLEGVIA